MCAWSKPATALAAASWASLPPSGPPRSRTVTTSDHDLGNGRYTLILANVGAHLRVTFGGEG